MPQLPTTYKLSPLGVEYSEWDNSPRIRFGRDGASAVRQFIVYDWAKIYTFARELLGTFQANGVVTTFRQPLPFPGFPALLVNDLSIDPHMPDSPDGDSVADLTTGTNSYDAGAIVTANYTARYDLQGGNNGPEIPEGTTILVSGDHGTETYSTPGRVWRWGTVAGNPVVDPDTFPGIVIPTGEWNVTWSRVPLPPWDTIRAARGKLNSSTFLGSPAGTVMFAGYTLRRMFQYVENSELWELTYRFREVIKERSDGTQVGWNYFYREQASGGEHWHTIQNVSGDKPYGEVDFATLFQFAVTVP